MKNYIIKRDGTIFSKRSKKNLKPEICKGYARVTFCDNNVRKRFLVHRLVAMKFISNTENKPCVNHKDGDKLNNHVNNLEWVTYSENERHSYDVLNKINNNRKLSNIAIQDIRSNCIKGKNQNNPGNVDSFIKKYNVSRKTILNVLNKKYYGS